MRPSLVAVLCLLASPAVSQDLSGQFAGAARAFTLPGTASLDSTDLMDDAAIVELLPRLEGDWGPLGHLFPDPMDFDPALFAESCERHPSTLVRTADRSFEMRRQSERDGVERNLTIRYDWVSGNSFDRGVSESELIPFMGLDAVEDIHPGMLSFPNMRGPAQLFYPGADILVIVAPHMPPEIWGRCPS